MSARRLPEPLRVRLLALDDSRCAYCRTSEANTGQPMTVDHIVPQAQGEPTELQNLCFACRRCNEFKGSVTVAQDPLTGGRAPLYNPRSEVCGEHFAWDGPATHLLGLTAAGRATVVALQMNHPVVVTARRRWVSMGWHPPEP